MPAGNKPRIMFVTDDKTKAAIEQWAADENRPVSGLLNDLIKEFLVQKGYLDPPKKLLNLSDRKT